MREALKILLLEDSPADADMVKRVLQKENMAVEYYPAMNREQFLAGLEHFQPDLVLSDNSMPQFTASDALEIFRGQSRFIPFILVTGTVSEEFAAGIIKLGADDFILKDRLARLPSAIENALKQKRIEREKNEAVQQLRQSEEDLRTIFDNTSEGFILLDSKYHVKAFNATGKKHVFFNSKRELTTGFSVIDFLNDDQAAGVLDIFARVMTGESVQFDYPHTNSGPMVWLNFIINPVLKDGVVDGICITARDISERKQAEIIQKQLEEEMIAQKLEEQKKITRAVMRAEEKERNYMGRELHDNVNQILAGAKLYFGNAGQQDKSLEALMTYPIELMDMCIREIRKLSKKLVAPIKDINLPDLVRSLLDTVAANSHIGTDLVYAVSTALSDELKLNIYRIIQEITTNTIKHAEAKSICVIIEETENMIKLIVTDDGKGFDTDQKRDGIGLSNMKNRVESFNGTMQIDTAAGAGCRTTISIPI